ncbi:MAG: hypothetical protein ACTHJW_02070 [Streptosporangiaceae bacterium]
MYSRQLEQLAKQRSTELRATTRSARRARPARTQGRLLRRHTGWALVSIGLRLAESGNR